MNMSNLVRTSAGLLMPFVLVFGFYIVIHGHLTPGGGFQGGAVIATAFLLLIVAHSRETIRERVSLGFMKNTETVGLMLFILTALIALFAGLAFFGNWLVGTGSLFGTPVAFGINPGDLNTGGVIPIMNLAVGLEVLGAMSVIILAMLSVVRSDA